MQQTLNLKDLALTERAHARGGVFRFYSLVEGEAGTPGNFFLQLSKTYSDFDSPRHRHNFDQVRLQLEGKADFARDGVMEPGTVGYFPEGVHYGPQSIPDESLTMVLQFGGASGSGYLSEDELQTGIAELKEVGTFERGIFKSRTPDGGTRSKDAYEAVWEHLKQRPLKYPPNRYTTPVFMQPHAYAWQPAGSPGVSRKLLGCFSEARTQLSMIRLDAGASLDVPANTVLFAVSGRGVTATGDAWEDRSSLYSGTAASGVVAQAPSELLEVRLPQL